MTRPKNIVSVYQLGRLDFEAACRLQEDLAAARAQEAVGDSLLLVQHPPVITIGQAGGWEDILAPSPLLKQQGVRVLQTDRGGKATYHGPGQLVAYPIFKVPNDDLYRFVRHLEEVVIRLLRTFELAAKRLEKYPGVWVNGNKVAALGLAVSDGVTRHGLALNVAPQLAHFDLFIPCGIADRGVTSMELELGRGVDMAEVMRRFVQVFGEVFGRQVVWEEPAIEAILPLSSLLASEGQPEEVQPPWLWQRVTPEAEAEIGRMAHLIADLRLHTVCQEARCPNIAECFVRGTATLMILGDTCTRGCRFCAVRRGQPAPVDATEPERVAEAAARLRLDHVVITSVTRDDLPDGGAGHFEATIRALRRRLAGVTVEVLIPDLRGSDAALAVVLEAEPDVLNHNVETVPRLYPWVRPRASYRRSLAVLARTKALRPRIVTKSGLMLGLGERTAEVVQVLHDLRQAQCDLLTLGQYLPPTDDQLPVTRYVPPEEFDWYREKAEALGFQGVASGPLVRSSYWAEAILAENAHPFDGCSR